MAKKTEKPAAKSTKPPAIKDMNAEQLAKATAAATKNKNAARLAKLQAASKALGSSDGEKGGTGKTTTSDLVNSNKDELFQNVGATGTNTVGTQLGKVRQIVAPNLGNAGQVDPNTLRIAPLERYGNSTIDPTSTYGGATIDQGMSNEARAQQMQFASQLQAQSLGQGPSVAGLQLKAALDKNVAQQNAMAASSNGVGRLLAQRRAALTTAGLGQEAARQSAMTRMAEQLNAQQLLGTQQQNIRTNDIGVAASQAGLVNQAGIATMEEQNKRAQAQAALEQSAAAGNATNANNQAAQQTIIDQAVAAANQSAVNDRATQQGQLQANADRYNQTEFDAANQAQLNANVGIQNTNTSSAASVAGAQAGANAQTAVAGIQANSAAQALQAQKDAQAVTNEQNAALIQLQKDQAANANKANTLDSAGKIISGAGTLAAGAATALGGSDRRMKENVKPTDQKMRDFVSNLDSYSWEYKDSAKGVPGVDSRTNNGVMAQDLEKSDAGKEMVIDTPRGKVVDYAKGMATILASQAALNKRLAAMEKKKAA